MLKQFCVLLCLCATAPPLLPRASESVPQRIYQPKEIRDPLPNPEMGWGIWAGPRYFTGRPVSLAENTTGFGTVDPIFGWVLIDWMWADLEPQEGKFDFHDLDEIISYWAARGKQIYLRPWITDDPGWNGAPGNTVVPEWVWNAGAKYRSYIGEGHSNKREPDYIDPSYVSVYLPRAQAFLKALAAKYDKPDSPVIMWGAMGYGQWGEWHVMWSHYPWPDRETKHRILKQIVDMYADTFRVRPVMISYCYDDDRKQVINLDDFLYRQALDEAIKKHFALARHGFIDGLEWQDKDTMLRYWPQAPMFAEGDWAYTDVKDQKTHGTMEEHLQVFREWHTNYAHMYFDAASYKRAVQEDWPLFERSMQAGGLGYRLVLASIQLPEAVPAGHLFVSRQMWMNENAGHCLRIYPLTFYLMDGDGREVYKTADHGIDETRWIAGEKYENMSEVRIDRNVTPGDYELRIALTNDKSKPAVALGIEGNDGQKRYSIGRIRILPADDNQH